MHAFFILLTKRFQYDYPYPYFSCNFSGRRYSNIALCLRQSLKYLQEVLNWYLLIFRGHSIDCRKALYNNFGGCLATEASFFFQCVFFSNNSINTLFEINYMYKNSNTSFCKEYVFKYYPLQGHSTMKPTTSKTTFPKNLDSPTFDISKIKSAQEEQEFKFHSHQRNGAQLKYRV